MSTLTTNLGLVKPSGNERPQVSVINANMDVLDAVIGDPSNLRSGSDITSDIKALRDSVYYRAGDTATFPWSSTFDGYISSSGTELTFMIPLSKPVVATSASITAGAANVRQKGSYLVSTELSLTSGYSSRNFVITPCGVAVQLFRSGGWGGTNNDLASVQVTQNMTITFS